MLIYDTFKFQKAKLKRSPLPHEYLEQTYKRKVDNQFVDQKSHEIYVSANFLVNFVCTFCLQKNILLMYICFIIV